MNAKIRRTGISAALASAVFLGFAPVFGKQAILFGFSPLAVVAIRTNLAALLLLVLMAIFRRGFFYIYPVGLVGCILAGFVNGLGSILYYSGLSRLDASIGQLLYSFYPLFLALWLLLDRQPLRKITILRLGLAVPGILLLVTSSQKSVDPIGAVMMVASAILYALHLIINQRILFEVPAPTVTFYTLLSMGITVLVAYLLFDRSLPAAGTSYGPLLALAAITFFSRITLFMGVKNIGGLQTGIMGLGELLITILSAWLMLGENLSTQQWLGALFVAASLILVGFDRLPPEKRRATGWLSWLNPPQINPTDFTFHS